MVRAGRVYRRGDGIAGLSLPPEATDQHEMDNRQRKTRIATAARWGGIRYR
jgi:hypothetical protein